MSSKYLTLLICMHKCNDFLNLSWWSQTGISNLFLPVTMTNAHKHNTLNVCMYQDGTNEHCQDKEHTNNNIMATVYRINNCISFNTPVIILYKKNILVLRQKQKSLIWCNLDWTWQHTITSTNYRSQHSFVCSCRAETIALWGPLFSRLIMEFKDLRKDL